MTYSPERSSISGLLMQLSSSGSLLMWRSDTSLHDSEGKKKRKGLAVIPAFP